jgi:hypothetical protein
LARLWSNRQLRRISTHLKGEIVNVSAGEDVDKEGTTYREYFVNKSDYYLTNFSPGKFRGFQGRANEFLVDLEAELPGQLVDRFDVAFNHTTLEHVFEVRKAFTNICRMSRDLVVVVVPFAQVQHESPGYGDFWRFTPTCLRRLFAENGLGTVYEAVNDDPNAAVYLFFVGSKNPARWAGVFPAYEPIDVAGSWIGRDDRRDWARAARQVVRRLVASLRRSR